MNPRPLVIVTIAACLAAPILLRAQNAAISPEEQAALDALMKARPPARAAPPALPATGPSAGPRPIPADAADFIPGRGTRGGPAPLPGVPSSNPRSSIGGGATVAVTISTITDSRTINSAIPAGVTLGDSLRLGLLINGDPADGATAVRQVRFTRAVDDLGNDLMPTNAVRPVLLGQQVINAVNPATRRNGLAANATLRSPVRAATMIKQAEGEVELFTASEADGSLLIIPDISQLAGTALTDPVLVKNGIRFTFINSDEQLNAVNAMAPGRRGGPAPGGPGRAGGPPPPVARAGFGAGTDFNMSAVSNYSDPNGRIVGYEFRDKDGNRLPTAGSSGSSNPNGTTSIQRLGTPFPKDAQLAIFISVPEAVKTFPFKFENVMLP